MKALLDGLPPVTDANLIVGYSTSDDAGVYRLSDELAIVVTADFITPPLDDPQPKFGLAVTGIVHPQRCWRNAGAQLGDALVLTKPIGSGVLLNANLKGWVSKSALAACIASLVTLNKSAAEAAADFDIHAATGITGFGLAGHTLEMARGAKMRFEIAFANVPLFDGARAMYERGVSTQATRANRRMVGNDISFAGAWSAAEEELLFDPQTNGGLLFAVAQAHAEALIARLQEFGVAVAARIGTVVEAHDSGHLLVS